MSPNRVLVYFDGACAPKNPGGISTYGFSIVQETPYTRQIASCHGVVSYGGPDSTNQRAEYAGCWRGLRWLADALRHPHRGELGQGARALAGPVHDLEVRGDSLLVIMQLSHQWQVRHPVMQRAVQAIRDTVFEIHPHRVVFEWIPREDNAVADYETKLAYEEACGRPHRECPKDPAKRARALEKRGLYRFEFNLKEW